MKASEYRAQLRAAFEAGREAIPFETCVELCAARYVWPEFEKSAKWRLEFEYVCNKYRVGVGLRADGRFAEALRREVANAKAAKKWGEVPAWVKDLAEKRYFIPAPVEGEVA